VENLFCKKSAGVAALSSIFERIARRTRKFARSTRIRIATKLLGTGDFEYWGRLSDEGHLAKRHIPLGTSWLDRGQTQFEFLKSIGLQPHHAFLDYGASQLATSRYLIPYLNPGKPVAADVGKAVLARGVDRLNELGIDRSRYHVIPITSPDLTELAGFKFDFIFSYSVLQYMNDENHRRVLRRFTELARPEARICLTYSSVLTHSFASRFCDCERFFGSAMLCEDGFGAGSPLEGLWVLVSMFDPLVNRGLEFGDVVEGSSPDALASDFAEQPLDEVEPGTGCRREVQCEAFVSRQPALHGRRLVGGVVVEDQV
jgi:hypothetical protein